MENITVDNEDAINARLKKFHNLKEGRQGPALSQKRIFGKGINKKSGLRKARFNNAMIETPLA